MYLLKLPVRKNEKQLIKYFKNKGLDNLLNPLFEKPKNLNVNIYKTSGVIKPVLAELFFLYELIILNNRLTILELGSGFSSLIMSLALHENSQQNSVSINDIRKLDLFKIYVLENEKKYLEITKKRNKHYFEKLNINSKISYNYSQTKMELYKGSIVGAYLNLPMCNPDFVYLDGPSQFKIKGSVNGINFNHDDYTPIFCDLLKIEYIFNPGSIIVIDGRYHNANYLKLNFKRNWVYKHVKYVDKHIFYLNEKPLGHISKKIMNFYKKK